MGFATFMEKARGTDFVAANIYGAWWFSALWAALTAAAIVYFIRRRVRRFSTVALHASFVVILAGALITHLTSVRGRVQLRQGVVTDTYMTLNGNEIEEHRLPFAIRLDKFEIIYHEGSTAPADYVSHVSIIGLSDRSDLSDWSDKSDRSEGSELSEPSEPSKASPLSATISMNNILSHGGVRLYQSDYDRDMLGSTLALNSDPWGIPVTYLGYALLFISLAWMLADPKGTFRRLLRSRQMACAIIAGVAICTAGEAKAAPVLPRETAEQFGRMNILYNGRICPVQTFAIDFTKKLCGRASYNGYTAEQVLTGFIFWGDEWSREPIIKMKGDALRERLMLPGYCSMSTFFNRDMGGYILGPYLRELSAGNNDRFHRDVADIDDRLMLIMEVRHGSLLKIFPYTAGGKTTWLSPSDKPEAGMPEADRRFIGSLLPLLSQYAAEGNYSGIAHTVGKTRDYQVKNGGTSIPSPLRIRAERIYNAVPFATILFILNLTLGLITLAVEIRRTAPQAARPTPLRLLLRRIPLAMMAVSFTALTVCEALRWIVSATVPMANGYETMLFVAWAVMLLSMLAVRRFPIVLTFGFIMSGFFLLVSHISQMDPDITHVMPVLNSPLLSIHVSVIMISFALLALTFICGVTAVVMAAVRGTEADGMPRRMASLQLLSRLFLYPAIATLAAGIFVGAIWANVSWGQYWGWDPKEVWALITMMIYAIAVHTDSLPALRRPLPYHIFMTAAFLTVLMTYFGVNYVLGGMHSYA